MSAVYSHSLSIIWELAKSEARHVGADQLAPGHLLIAVCKIVDLDLVSLVPADCTNRDAVLEETLREVRRLRGVFKSCGLDARSFRRRLRQACATALSPAYLQPHLRRNPAAKAAFLRAEQIAELSGSPVFPVHLLCAILNGSDERVDAAILEQKLERNLVLDSARHEAFFGSGNPENINVSGFKPN